MPDHSDIVAAKLEALAGAMKEEFGDIKAAIGEIKKELISLRENTVPRNEYNKDIINIHRENKRLESDIKGLKGQLTWVIRSVALAIMGAVITVIESFFS